MVEKKDMKIKDGFGDYLKYLQKKGLQEKTIREHRRFIYGALSHAELLQDKDIKKLRLVDVASVIEAGRLHGTFGPQRAVCVFRNYLKFLKEKGERLPFDYRDIEVPHVTHKEQPVLSEDEFSTILDSFPIDSLNTGARRMAWTMKTFCEILFGTTMRAFEALSLRREQWPEIKEKREIIIKGKGGDERPVYFTDRAIYWLDLYLKQRIENDPAMFVNSYGDPLKMVTAKSYLLRFRKRFGELGKKLKTHTFRRTSTTMMMERGMDLRAIMVIGGWKSERTVLRHYAIANRPRAKLEHQRILATI